MDFGWSSVAELQVKLIRLLEGRHAGAVTKLSISLEGDTLTLRGEVASEGCKGDAKRLLLAFNGVLKVRNELVVAGFLEAASDDVGDYFGWTEPSANRNLDQQGADRDFPQPDGSHADRTGASSSHHPDRQQPHRSKPATGPNPTPDGVEVVRHPAVKATGFLAPGHEVRVEVDLTMDGWHGASPISLGRFPRDWQTITVHVQLFAPWAAEMTIEEANVTVSADGTSRPARFKLVVSNDYVAGASAQVHASFLHGTRVCGHLSRNLADIVGRTTKEAEDAGVDAAVNVVPTVAIVPDASGPSLSVSIICNSGGQQTWMWIAQLPDGVEQDCEQINLGSGDQAFAEALLRTCPDLGATVFRRAMAGVGERLWAAAPARFRSAYTGWRAKLGPNFPIQFVSDDPHVPWEMMKPDVAGVDHLFLDHPVARWPLKTVARRRHNFPGGALLSFVPKYDAGRALPSAEAEGEWVCVNLDAVAMTATSASFLDVLDGRHPTPVGILHFAGHGTIDTGIADGGIDMEDRLIGVGEVNQSRVVLGRQDGTLVVLNACETSAGSQLLGMNTGWGSAIAAREFGGLIAPLWEVQDDVALAMVQAALPPLIAGNSSLGAAVTAARRASGETSISAFAYLAHGDVMARFARS